jgi:hypothetical protein
VESTQKIPSGEEHFNARAEGLLCRGVFNIVRVDVIRIPNDADFSEFFDSLLEDPVRTARYQNLKESASKLLKTIKIANLIAANKNEVMVRSHLRLMAKPVFFRALTA